MGDRPSERQEKEMQRIKRMPRLVRMRPDQTLWGPAAGGW